MADSLVSVSWLTSHLDDPFVVVIDASWYLPDSGRDAEAEYRSGHIPGAVFYDVDAHSRPDPLPHMCPTEEQFASSAMMLGIEPDSTVVVYDGSGNNLSAARVWWVFRSMGFQNIAVLDGGLAAWRDAGGSLESGWRAPLPALRPVAPRFDRNRFVDLTDLLSGLDDSRRQVVDARSRGRFEGSEPEPRSGIRGGHIPGSLSLHYRELVDPATGRLLDTEDLMELMAARGVDLSREIVATCGSGMSACALLLALDQLGCAGSLYDGSWVEWGGLPHTPVSTGDQDPA